MNGTSQLVGRWVQDLTGNLSDGAVLAVIAAIATASVLVVQYIRARRR